MWRLLGSLGVVLAAVHRFLLRVFRRLPTRARVAIVHVLAPEFTVGAMCIVERADGALLLVRHSYRNAWGVPGGLLKRGEDARDAARREAFEELGINVELTGEPAVVVDPTPRRVDVIFPARVVGNPPEPFVPRSPEIVEARWFPADELPPLQFETSGALMALARAGRSARHVASLRLEDAG